MGIEQLPYKLLLVYHANLNKLYLNYKILVVNNTNLLCLKKIQEKNIRSSGMLYLY